MAKKKFLCLLSACALTLVFGFSGCDLGNDDDGDIKDNEINFSQPGDPSDRLFRVTNQTSKNLVAFKGTLKKDNLIGGIPAKADEFWLSKANKILFPTGTSTDFALVLITVEDYEEYKNNLDALEATPFTRLYGFYNANGTNEQIYEITGRLGGSGKLIVQNSTNMNIELRLNSPTGETLGYAAKGQYNTMLYLDEELDYLVFPVFKRYNAREDQIITIYPKYTSGDNNGNAKFKQFAFTDGVSEIEILASDFSSGESFSTGSAYLIINNIYGNGIVLNEGDTPVRSETGVRTINNGKAVTFTVTMTKVAGTTAKYSTTRSIETYKLGPTAGIGPQNLKDRLYEVSDGSTEVKCDAAKAAALLNLATDTIYQIDAVSRDDSLRFIWRGEQGTVDLDDFTSDN